jgi:Predicted nucleic-acid-binding protein, contains PIN domain
VRKLGLKHDVARAAIERLLPWCIAPMTATEVQLALDLADSRKMSWWDALMISSALGAGCTHFLTEDVQSAPEVDGMQIVDPFTTALEAVLKG